VPDRLQHTPVGQALVQRRVDVVVGLQEGVGVRAVLVESDLAETGHADQVAEVEGEAVAGHDRYDGCRYGVECECG